MSDQADKFKSLQDKLASILAKQETLNIEILQLRHEIAKAIQAISAKPQEEPPAIPVEQPQHAPVIESIPSEEKTTAKPESRPQPPFIPRPPQPQLPPVQKKSDWERFIGENLISKIGILVLIIGIGMGVKYAIDNDLASPPVRIIFGYVCSLALLGTAVKLKRNYNNFSAVLFSGGIATAYFTTYFASNFYHFIPREAAFPIMIAMTVGTVAAATWYKREVIAHIGLWGAYAIPVLLGSGSNKTEWLFLYMLIINVGMIVISHWQKWRLIFLNAFISSWVIFISIVIFKSNDAHAKLDLLFATAFFLLFLFSAFIIDWKRKAKGGTLESIFVILNGIIFLGLGSYLVEAISHSSHYASVFLFANAIVYLSLSLVSYSIRFRDVLFKILFSLGLFTLVIAIPIKFDAIQTAFLWSLIIIALHLLKKYTQLPFFTIYTFPLYPLVAIFAFICWASGIDVSLEWRPIVRNDFLWSMLLIGGLAVSYVIQKFKKEVETGSLYVAGITCIVLLYFSFLFEIIYFFNWKYMLSEKILNSQLSEGTYTAHDSTIFPIAIVWSVVYTLLFLALLKVSNIFYQKQKTLFILHQVLLGGAVFLFLFVGLSALYYLDSQYLHPTYPEVYPAQSGWITIRYVLFGSFAALLFTEWLYVKKAFVGNDLKNVLTFIFHFLVLVVVSHEMLHWSRITGTPKIDKYGLSLFWGLYALFLVGYGIWKSKKAFRIAGIVVLGVTLIKLFFYDIANLGNIIRILLFLAIGALMLLISFLYNKYKDTIK